jgi:hypothetical protein
MLAEKPRAVERTMARDSRVWLLLLGLAIALTVACSGSGSPSGGGDAAETAPDAMTQG